MSMCKSTVPALLLAGSLIVVLTGNAQEPAMNLGIPVTEAQLQGYDLVVAPEGGLPAGSGSARTGEQVYNRRCAACHGNAGEGVSGNTVIAGGDMQTDATPLRTVGSYWPHASTLFDFVRRAMPADAPKSLTNDEVYQVTAYVLFLNGIIDADTVVDARTLTGIVMPNADGFVDRSHIR